ncbi:hypothetical protein [Flavobacterium xueshanense]
MIFSADSIPAILAIVQDHLYFKSFCYTWLALSKFCFSGHNG